ncbi:MAG: metal-dependent hydrolase [Methanoregula sp.]|uniref:metal-dependent hydrolase n=1 Tax=Methanoregula sp. TaxID=2052170 RepID=UPI003D0D5090
MDSLTHALAAAIIAYSLGSPQFFPFAVIGAVIIDTDILFSLISDSHPSLYLFVHGGIAHSLAGAVVMSALAYTGITLAALAGLIDPAVLVRAGPAGFAAVLFGAFLHIAMDLPATPGIPLFAPKSDKKYALFILPGPSLFMLTVSLFFLIWLALGVVTLAEGMAAYAAILVAFLLVRFVAFLASRPALRGTMRAIPQVNPLRWLAISDSGYAWTVRDYRIGLGMTDPVNYPKYKNTSPEEVVPCLALPEVMRLRYYSYIVTAEKEGDTILFFDPLRVSGRLFYPPHFKQVRIAIGVCAPGG